MSIDNLYAAHILADTLVRAKLARARQGSELVRTRAVSDAPSLLAQLRRIGRRPS